jgi:acyl-CoA synthetase (AMP-forming)/AMP-acid ligase II
MTDAGRHDATSRLPLELIGERALATPDHTAVICDGRTISYAAFVADIVHVADQIRAASGERRGLAGVMMASNYAQFVALNAAHLVGCASIALPVNTPARLQASRERLDLLVTDQEIPPSGKRRHQVVPVRLDDSARAAHGQTLACPLADAELMHVRMTSGTTGGYKKIGVTRRQFEDWAQATTALYENRGPSRYLSLTPPHLGLGLIKALSVWVLGGTVIFDDRGNGFDAIAANEPEEFVATPYFVYRWLKDLDERGLNPPRHLHIRLDGAKVSRTLWRDLSARVACDLECGYGSAELGVVAFADLGASGDTWLDRFRTAPWAEIEMVDRFDQPVPTGQTGILRARTGFMPEGYLDDVNLSARQFRNGWYYSGDRGRMLEGGLFELEGREGDLLNLSGYKVYCPNIEHEIQTIEGIDDAAAYAILNEAGIEELGIALVCNPRVHDRKPVIEAAKQRAQRSITVGLERVSFVFVNTIPRNDMGKVMRRQLSAAHPRAAPGPGTRPTRP